MYVHLCTPVFFWFVFIYIYLCDMIHLMPTANGKESTGNNADWLQQSPVQLNYKKMNIKDLVAERNVMVAVSVADLREFALYVMDEAKKEAEDNIREETYLTPPEVAKMIGVSTNTLGRWEKEKYLAPLKVGRKSRYRKSDVEALMTGRNNKEKEEE